MRSRTDNERTRRLCAVLGHELRNPLASAVTNVSIAAAMMDPGDPRSGYLQQAQGDLERMASLLTAYLEFGRVGRAALRRVDLVDVVRAVVSRKPGTRVRFEVNRAPIRGDADLLGRAVENMIENAFDAGASEVEVRLTESDGGAVLEISDDGPGVAAELRDALFEPFVSGRGSSGLGLAVTRDVIESHGGHVSLGDSRRGRGAEFRIILPLAAAQTELQASV